MSGLIYTPSLTYCKKCNELVEMEHYFHGWDNVYQCPKCGFKEVIKQSTEIKTVKL